tara:strand:- start:37 stop:459 length:423 start_codon:yes stop_codon:yes gene_type:complete
VAKDKEVEVVVYDHSEDEADTKKKNKLLENFNINLYKKFKDEILYEIIKEIEKLLGDEMSKYENKRFIRTDKLITSKASHNIKRLEWIAEAGSKGRSYSELNRKNSIYRQNIKRKTYKGNDSKITVDISYDIKQGMIKEK